MERIIIFNKKNPSSKITLNRTYWTFKSFKLSEEEDGVLPMSGPDVLGLLD